MQYLYVSTTETESLRDRKARLTRRAIHVAAVNRVLEDGLEQATVAQIAEDAGISARTFFNYFASKEDAIVGMTDVVIDTDQIEEFLEVDPVGADLAEDVARLIYGTYQLTFNSDDVVLKRRQILARYPALMRRQFEKNEAIEYAAAEVVAARLRRGDIDFGGADGTPEELALMLVQLCAVPLRFAVRTVMQSEPDQIADPDFSKETFERSIRLFRSVLAGTQTPQKGNGT